MNKNNGAMIFFKPFFFLWTNLYKVRHGRDQKCVVLHSSALDQHSAPVACVVKSLRHHRNASAASR